MSWNKFGVLVVALLLFFVAGTVIYINFEDGIFKKKVVNDDYLWQDFDGRRVSASAPLENNICPGEVFCLEKPLEKKPKDKNCEKVKICADSYCTIYKEVCDPN